MIISGLGALAYSAFLRALVFGAAVFFVGRDIDLYKYKNHVILAEGKKTIAPFTLCFSRLHPRTCAIPRVIPCDEIHWYSQRSGSKILPMGYHSLI